MVTIQLGQPKVGAGQAGYGTCVLITYKTTAIRKNVIYIKTKITKNSYKVVFNYQSGSMGIIIPRLLYVECRIKAY